MSQLLDLIGETRKEKVATKKAFGKNKDGSKYVDTKPELVEAPVSNTAVIAFGRMNPITIGHEKLVNAVISTALKEGAVPLIYLSHSTDPKKNPLTYDQKIAFAKKAFGTKLIVKSKARTIIEVAKELQNKFKKLIIVAGSDRVTEFDTLLNKYNGKEYTYDSIKVVSAGDRDPDADDVSGMSASKMRAAAADNDFDMFKGGLPRKLQPQAKSVYNTVRAGMGIKEAIEEVELEEALTRQQRLQRKMLMRRLRSKIMMGRRRAMRRKATVDVLKKRAKRLVIRALKKRFAKTNNYADLPYSARQRIDDRIARIPKKRLDILARRFLPRVKKAERDRFANKVIQDKPKNPTVRQNPIKTIKTEEFNIRFEAFLKERMQTSFLSETFEDKVRRAVSTAHELGRNMNYAIKEIEKIKKGLSRHSLVKEALERANENFNEEAYQQYTLERRMSPQDPHVKKMPGSQPKNYYKDVAVDKKDDRARHFAKNAKKSDEDPSAYEPAPGDAEAKTKPSKHTNKFKKIFGETNYEKAMMKRPHMLLARNGSVVIDKRFKMFKKAKDTDLMLAQLSIANMKEDLEQIMESTDFIFESNPDKSLRDKAEKTGIAYGILKKVFDRGVAAWRTGHRPGTTPTQWGLARVNSFATGGKTQKTTDKDLWDQHKGNKSD